MGKHLKNIGVGLLLCSLVCAAVWTPDYAQAQLVLPRISLSPEFTPAIIRGMRIEPNNPFALSFLIDPGNDLTPPSEHRKYYQKLIKYFLSALTIAEDKQWVNLSPYEGTRMIDSDFGKTEMGADLLAQDYILKQTTAAMINPNAKIGREFWAEVYKQAAERFGTAKIPISTFNKVWILPETAAVYEKGNTVLIVESRLKVMLEQDYLAFNKNNKTSPKGTATSQIVREIILPHLTREVNEGKNFANLRQIYHGMILATWYKQALQKSILTQIYANQNKVKGVDLSDPAKSQQKIYQNYVRAFKKGSFSFIKEEKDRFSGQVIPRKYFSGGFRRVGANAVPLIRNAEPAMAAKAWKDLAAKAIIVETLLSPFKSPRSSPAVSVPMAIAAGISGYSFNSAMSSESKSLLLAAGVGLLSLGLYYLWSPLVLPTFDRPKVDVKLSEPDYQKYPFTDSDGIARWQHVIVVDINDQSLTKMNVLKRTALMWFVNAETRKRIEQSLPKDGQAATAEEENVKEEDKELYNLLLEIIRGKGKPPRLIVQPLDKDLAGKYFLMVIEPVKTPASPAKNSSLPEIMGKEYGGIDFNNVNFNLRIKKDGQGVPLPLENQDPAMRSAPGFVPLILEIKPALGLPILSELKDLTDQSSG